MRPVLAAMWRLWRSAPGVFSPMAPDWLAVTEVTMQQPCSSSATEVQFPRSS